MPIEQRFISLWLAGLVLFGGVIWLSLPLAIEAVPGGIIDHQAAGSAAEVSRIQQAWARDDLTGNAQLAMLGDIAFIVVYGMGGWFGGLTFMQDARPRLKRLGWLLAGAAALFLASDLIETLAQIVQLMGDRGSDGLAKIAAIAQPIKMAAFLVTLVGVVAGLAVRRFSPPIG